MAKYEFSAARLILLGVIHSDPSGYKRTLRFLSEYRPDLVMVEISPFALRYRQENANRLHREFRENLRAAAQRAAIDYKVALKHPRIFPIRLQISIPFEYRVSSTYGAQSGTKVVPVDWSDFSKEWIATWPELISTANLEVLLKLDNIPIPVSHGYDQAARAICGKTSTVAPWAGIDTIPWQKREEHIAAEVRKHLEVCRSGRAVYIGGWRHLVSGVGFRTIRDIFEIGIMDCFLLDRGRISPCAEGMTPSRA